MKKITIFIITIFTVATLFAAARPSLDGRAVVADGGTMPKGLFARTVGYLPGDSVTVTNPATGSTIDVLILGAIDPSEGVAILLSPEAADGLRIKPDSNVQVKLTKRSGSLDENANGSAVISEGEDEPAPIEEKSEPAVAETSAPQPAVTEYPAVSEEKTEPEEETVEEIPVVAEKAPVVEEIPAVAEEEAVEETPVVAEKPVEEVPVEETPAVAKVETVVTNPVVEEEAVPETVYEELPPLPKDEKLQKVVVIETEEPTVTEEEVASVEEQLQPASASNTVIEEKVEVAVEEPEIAAADQPVEIEELPAVEEEPVIVVEEKPLPVEEKPVVAETEAPMAVETADAYQPIVLVPAEPNPPVAEEVVAESNPPVAEEIVAVEEKAPVVAEPAPVPVKKECPKIVVSNNWTNYVVPSLKNLRSGSYYVQVASYGNPDNIKNFVDKYSNKYPVVLVQNFSKSAYQVMVGPLNIDEYGSIDEKFKAYGFKDSFIRKIK